MKHTTDIKIPSKKFLSLFKKEWTIFNCVPLAIVYGPGEVIYSYIDKDVAILSDTGSRIPISRFLGMIESSKYIVVRGDRTVLNVNGHDTVVSIDTLIKSIEDNNKSITLILSRLSGEGIV